MTEFRKNQYEEIIDQMMIDEVAGMDNDIREMLSGLETKKKRRAILSILDKDRGLFSRINKLITHMGIGVGKAEYITEVVTMLREYVKVGDVEKKKFGEVMTPISLVEEMLDKLPEEVWSNPSLKWLDSCNGVGIFPSVVVKRLMVGLTGFEPDEELRYKHIVENMLYVGELQPKNMFLFLCSFDPKDEYELNVYTGSFLDAAFDTHMKEVWGIEKFDIIVGNPPYQNVNSKTDKAAGGSNTLWDKFVIRYISVLCEGGYLNAVHPSGWRNIDGKLKTIQTLIKSKHLQYLEIHNSDDGKKTFGATTRYDWYCLKNSTADGEVTTIKDESGTLVSIDISAMEFIPNGDFAKIANLISTGDEDKVNVLNNSSYHIQRAYMSKEKTDEFFHPCLQNINTKNVPDCIWYSNTNLKGHFGIPKLIFGSFGINVYIDTLGEYGMSQHCTAIIDDVAVLPSIKKALQSERFKKLMKDCDVAGIRDTPINRKVVAKFRKDFWKEFVDEPVAEEDNAA